MTGPAAYLAVGLFVCAGLEWRFCYTGVGIDAVGQYHGD